MTIDSAVLAGYEAEQKYFEALAYLVKERQGSTETESINSEIERIYELIRELARTNNKAVKVIPGSTFGTSGWRGIIGDDYTCQNVIRITKALISTLKDTEIWPYIGVKSFEEVCERGIAVIHDNRFMGPDFAKIVLAILNDAGIKTYYGGEATTAEISICADPLNLAASINLTPSHNPFTYAGYKVNPSDGGPAGSEITSRIEHYAAKEMTQTYELPDTVTFQEIKTIAYYRDAFQDKLKHCFDLDALVNKINASDIKIVVDNVHGATRGTIEYLLNGVSDDKVSYLRTDTDYLFNGVKPEPSNDNLKLADSVLAESNAKLKLAVIMDPDGDRIRFSDGTHAVDMNVFGPMLAYFLIKEKGLKGGICKSVASSNFANAVAASFDRECFETRVGFKEFRKHLKANEAVVAFEESDGITVQGWGLDKDALVGCIAAIAMILDTGMQLGDYLDVVKDDIGYYYPDKDGQEVDRSLVGPALRDKLAPLEERFAKGVKVTVNGSERIVNDMITLDGHKMVFDNGSWILIRPSGTEPKVRFYVEGRDADETAALIDKAKQILASLMG